VNIKTEFKPQFYQNGEITTQPDSIQLTGPASMLDTIQSLNTEKLEIKNIDSDIERTAKILHPENTNINEEKVFVQIPVERFTEKEITVPVQVKNKPQDLNIKLFPAQVKISFLVGLNKYENITAADFNVYVDYNEADYDTEMLEIKIESKPSFIQMLRISPQAVEFLIEID
jgi:YbbR domain-containing protein